MPAALDDQPTLDRALVAAAALAIAALAWLRLADDARAMSGGMTCCAMTAAGRWSLGDASALFVMWTVMMIGMMTPTVLPTLLLFVGLQRRRKDSGRPFVPAMIFLGGYLASWTAFSLAAAVAQEFLHASSLLSPMMESSSPRLSGAMLVAAGIFQWLPAKEACLAHCRTPLAFLMTEWREGRSGAFVMGARHGAYCVGCCWALMGLLFVAGVMNLAWVAALTLFVLGEKMLPIGRGFARVIGAVSIVGGIAALL